MTSKLRRPAGPVRRSPAVPAEARILPVEDVEEEEYEPADLATLIESERRVLLEAHSLMQCLKEVLTGADFDEALFYADLAGVAAKMVNESVARLDATQVMPMIEALRPALRTKARARQSRIRVSSGKLEVREARPVYLC
ncbi:hypothetical protein ACG33_02945 [Steroidobacter denitrificans]|uniref:Uncharacterized protein n=1 Tax=Steroidobacter denitrificans TaxID=465721 RepID=A0A127F6L6_STEDE|nr:hypothetical protein ACG33_02945 [Steroidobacter denitrificans]